MNMIEKQGTKEQEKLCKFHPTSFSHDLHLSVKQSTWQYFFASCDSVYVDIQFAMNNQCLVAIVIESLYLEKNMSNITLNRHQRGQIYFKKSLFNIGLGNQTQALDALSQHSSAWHSTLENLVLRVLDFQTQTLDAGPQHLAARQSTLRLDPRELDIWIAWHSNSALRHSTSVLSLSGLGLGTRATQAFEHSSIQTLEPLEHSGHSILIPLGSRSTRTLNPLNS